MVGLFRRCFSSCIRPFRYSSLKGNEVRHFMVGESTHRLMVYLDLSRLISCSIFGDTRRDVGDGVKLGGMAVGPHCLDSLFRPTCFRDVVNFIGGGGPTTGNFFRNSRISFTNSGLSISLGGNNTRVLLTRGMGTSVRGIVSRLFKVSTGIRFTRARGCSVRGRMGGTCTRDGTGETRRGTRRRGGIRRALLSNFPVCVSAGGIVCNGGVGRAPGGVTSIGASSNVVAI